MPDAVNTSQLPTVQYSANVELALNDAPGMIYPLAGSSQMYKGPKAQILDRFDDLYMDDKTTRNGDTNNVEVTSNRRWVNKPPSANVAPLIDRDDFMNTSVDIESPIVQQTARAGRRYHDDMFLLGLYGNAATGTNGDVSTPFKPANEIAAGGTGLTKAKLIQLREAYNKADVDIVSEKPILILTPEAESDLLNITEYANSDYNDSKPLVNGEIKPWMGFRFVSVNLLSLKAFPRSAALFQSGTVHKLPSFVPSGAQHAIWEMFYGRVTERDDKQFSKQVYGEACSVGARLHEDKVFLLDIDAAA